MNKVQLRKAIRDGIVSQKAEVQKKIQQLMTDGSFDYVLDELLNGQSFFDDGKQENGVAQTQVERNIARINERLAEMHRNCVVTNEDKDGSDSVIRKMAALRGCTLPGAYLNKKH